jgi:hypothetical protein
MLKYDQETPRVTRISANMFTHSGMYIATQYITETKGNLVLDTSMLNMVRRNNPQLNLHGLSVLIQIPETLIGKVLHLGGRLYKAISQTGNDYYIHIQG